MSGIVHIIYDIIVCFSDKGEGAWPCPTEACCACANAESPNSGEGEGKLHYIPNVHIIFATIFDRYLYCFFYFSDVAKN